MNSTLQVSLSLVIGALASLYHPAALFFLAFLVDKQFLQTIVIALASAAMVWFRAEMPSSEFEGAGMFTITAVAESNDNWLYRGYWYPRGKAIPVTVAIDNDGITARPPVRNDWWVEGRLQLTETGRYRLKIDPYKPWIAIPYTYNLGEWRLHAKKHVKNWIESNINSPSSATFLTGIATGSFDDAEMIAQFSRFGLQHIMAISGFHFALIAGFLGWCIRPILGYRNSCAALIILLTVYCIFLGYAPSVMRAWMTLILALWGLYTGRTASGLNTFSLALAILVVWDPLLLTTIGFTFSCLTTAGILLFYRPAEKVVEKLLPARTLTESVNLSFLDQHGYCLGSLLRKMLALTLAVNMIAVPVTLYYFNYFPLMSVLYNLFFPLLVTVSMVLLILSIGLPFLHPVNEAWTHYTLTFTSNMPAYVDFGISVDGMTPWILGGILGVFYLFLRRERVQAFAYRQSY